MPSDTDINTVREQSKTVSYSYIPSLFSLKPEDSRENITQSTTVLEIQEAFHLKTI